MQKADKSMFVRPCNDFPLARVQEILSLYCRDTQRIRQCWPWVAFAADQYRFERKERTKRSEKSEPTPTEIVELIDTIEQSAKAFVRSITMFSELAYRTDDPTAPSRRPHLAYIDELIAQAAAGFVPGCATDDAKTGVVSHFGRLRLLERVALVQDTAHHAKSLISTDLLKRPSAQPRDVALINLVDWIGRIWIELAGKKPNASPSLGNPRPPFVRLVAAMVKMAGGPEPDAWQIKRALEQRDKKKHKRRTTRKR